MMQNDATHLATALAILSAMITPAVLISACGQLVISTSARLGRTVDRTRKVLSRFEEIRGQESLAEERRMLYEQLNFTTRRSRLLQRALTMLYLALAVFVATSVSIGMVALSGQRYDWIPVAFGMVGAGLLFLTSLLLIAEARLTWLAVNNEMDFVLRRTRGDNA
jgi:hypothetical protein